MDAVNPDQALALARRRRQMLSIRHELDGILLAAINAGDPFLASPRWRALLLQFEAGRVRVEAYCKGNPITNDDATEALEDREH